MISINKTEVFNESRITEFLDDFILRWNILVNSGVPQGSVLGPLLFLSYVNDIWRNTESNERMFAGECTIYKKITNSSDIDALQTGINRLGEWVVKNEVKINTGKSKEVSFTKVRVKERIRYYFRDQLIPEARSFKYLGIIICSDLNWAYLINYDLQKE